MPTANRKTSQLSSTGLSRAVSWLAAISLLWGVSIVSAQGPAPGSPGAAPQVPPAFAPASQDPPLQSPSPQATTPQPAYPFPELNAQFPVPPAVVPRQSGPLFSAPPLAEPNSQSGGGALPNPAPFPNAAGGVSNPAANPAGAAFTAPSAFPETALQSSPTIATWGEFVNAQIIARVGNETILAADVIGPVNKILEPHKDKMSADEYQENQQKLMKDFLKQILENKILYADAVSKIPKENMTKMESAVADQFEKSYVKKLMELNKSGSRAELEKKLADSGSSLEKQQRMFFERSIAVQWERQNVKSVDDIPLAELLANYKNHSDDYEIKGQALWEEIMVSFEKIPDKPTAYRTMADWGNMVFQGQPFGAVAEKHSHGPTSFKQGRWDWTTAGSQKSKILEAALFAMPVGQLSAIIEDESGFHIVRVLERKEAGRVPFEKAQAAIRESLLTAAQDRVRNEYLVKVSERIPVWTIFDGQLDPKAITLKGSGATGRKKR